MQLPKPSKSIEDEIKQDLATLEKDAITDAKKIEQEYVHIPGTTHLNAFIADVEEAKKKVTAATAELRAAEERLLNKKIESGMIK